jgi:transcriptional regulator with XRE-family HTH domain
LKATYFLQKGEKEMSDIGLAIRGARLNKNFTQDAVGSMGFCSGKLVSAIERGERQASMDFLEKLTKEFDDPRLYMEAANEITGGVFGVSWLDGEGVDLHRSSVKEKLIEELSEAIRAINQVKAYDNPKLMKAEQKQLARKSILESIDAFNCIAHYIAVMCNELGFSSKELFEEHKRKLIERGYLKR